MDVGAVETVKKPLLLRCVRRMLSRYFLRVIEKLKIAWLPGAWCGVAKNFMINHSQLNGISWIRVGMSGVRQ